MYRLKVPGLLQNFVAESWPNAGSENVACATVDVRMSRVLRASKSCFGDVCRVIYFRLSQIVAGNSPGAGVLTNEAEELMR